MLDWSGHLEALWAELPEAQPRIPYINLHFYYVPSACTSNINLPGTNEGSGLPVASNLLSIRPKQRNELPHSCGAPGTSLPLKVAL